MPLEPRHGLGPLGNGLHRRIRRRRFRRRVAGDWLARLSRKGKLAAEGSSSLRLEAALGIEEAIEHSPTHIVDRIKTDCRDAFLRNLVHIGGVDFFGEELVPKGALVIFFHDQIGIVIGKQAFDNGCHPRFVSFLNVLENPANTIIIERDIPW